MKKVIKTGLPEIDATLGGGLINRGNLLISYDRRSLGWVLALKIFKNMLNQIAVGVIFNTTLPLSKLKLRANYLGLDLENEGNKGNLYIIDIFGSKYNIPQDEPYVYQIKEWSDETALPKLIRLYQELATKIPKDKIIVGLVATLEGLYHEFGERFMNNTIKTSLASFEKGELRKMNMVTISLLNREAVPHHITAWLYSLSDQIIEFTSQMTPEGLKETVIIPKSLLPSFRTKCYTMKISEKEEVALF